MVTNPTSFGTVFPRSACPVTLFPPLSSHLGRACIAGCGGGYRRRTTSLQSYISNCSAAAATINTSTGLRRWSGTNRSEEHEVGIFCYVSQFPGFRAILKHRYSDFIVNEVDIDGNVVHLTCLDAPDEGGVDKRDDVFDILRRDYTEQIEKFKVISGNADAEILRTFLDRVNASTHGTVSHAVLLPDSDKAHRTAVRKFLMENFKFMLTDTIYGSDGRAKCIRVRVDYVELFNRRSKSGKCKNVYEGFDSGGADDWPSDVGKFLRFNLFKKNKSTQDVLRLIGKLLGVNSRSFGFAGAKDKRSVSTQRVTIFKQHAQKLASLNDKLVGVKVGDFCYVSEGLFLGNLLGNRFTIVLRGVVADSEDVIRTAANSLGNHGFINYFGLQRFGCGTMPTHLIGAALLRGDWRAALNMILDPIREENVKDIAETLRHLPHDMVARRAILESLKRWPGDYLQALKAIPRNLRMLYVHSYQSYLWNHAASARVQKYGVNQIVLGDLVHCEVDPSKEVVDLTLSESDTCTSDHADEVSITDSTKQGGFQVKTITASDLADGIYKACDVVLPLPGYKTIYPNNDIAEVYHDLARKDGISLARSVHSAEELSLCCLTGGYRKVLQRPIDLEWELLTYFDKDQPLTETDMDRILNSELHLTDNGNLKQSEFLNVDTDLEKAQGYKALKLSFTLPASSYATMAVRELLKSSTSVFFQKTLSH